VRAFVIFEAVCDKRTIVWKLEQSTLVKNDGGSTTYHNTFLTQHIPLKHKESQILSTDICPCTMDTVYAKLEDFVTFLYVLVNVAKVTMR